MISHQNWKRNWGNNRKKKWVFFSKNFDSREENLFAKSHSIEKRKRNFLQNLEFREENENFVFKILTIESISRNEHSILQLEIEKMDHFPSRFFRDRESRQCLGHTALNNRTIQTQSRREKKRTKTNPPLNTEQTTLSNRTAPCSRADAHMSQFCVHEEGGVAVVWPWPHDCPPQVSCNACKHLIHS